MKLALYFYNECPFCMMVIHTIEQLGIEDQIEMKNVRKYEEFAKELLELNGKKQVPCLTIDRKPMLESREIIQYLENQFSN